MNSMERLEYDINTACEASSVCRGEVCRSLESEIDALGSRLSSLCSSEGTCSTVKVGELKEKIHTAYGNIPSKTNI